MLNSKKISIIGAGHLGSALAKGLIKNGFSPQSIMFSNRDPQKLTDLVNKTGVLPARTNTDAVSNADIIILAVKPQFVQPVCEEIAPTIKDKTPLIISLAGVISIKNIALWLEKNEHGIVRAMTNTPTEFCKGTTALFTKYLTPDEKKLSDDLFNAVGSVFWVNEESMLDTLTAPIGCAPAYVFLFMEALQKATESRGIPEDLAAKIALQSVLGAAELASHSGRSFATLRAGVTTPHGVTEHSLQQLSIDDFFTTFKDIFAAAEERIAELINSSTIK